MATSAAMVKPIEQPACSFLNKLPAEMRNTIYELVFTSIEDQNKPVDLLDPSPPTKSLLLTCRQINSEARGIYKSAYRNYWRTSDFLLLPQQIDLFPDSIAKAGLSRYSDLDAIKHITVTVGGYAGLTTLQLVDPIGIWKFTDVEYGVVGWQIVYYQQSKGVKSKVMRVYDTEENARAGLGREGGLVGMADQMWDVVYAS